MKSRSQSKVDKGRYILDKGGMEVTHQLPLHCLSVVRLYSLFERNLLPERFHIAGRIFFNDLKGSAQKLIYLEAQGLRLELDAVDFSENHLSQLSCGDSVCFEAMRGSLSKNDAALKVKSIQRLQLLQKSSAILPPFQLDHNLSLKWAQFISGVREVLMSRALIEVTTPSLVQNPGMEPQLEPFSTEFRFGQLRKKLFLPTSPELHLKQMLCLGLTDIFEIKTCFRNGELTVHHQPEFQMLEWYRAYTGLEDIVLDVISLLNHFDSRIGEDIEVEIVSIKELFQKHLGFSLQPDTSVKEMQSLCQKENLDWSITDSWDDLFHRLMIEKIEPQIQKSRPTIVMKYPPSQAALARIDSLGWAERFELYWQGYEIANAFFELNDPQVQRERFQNEQKIRKENGKTALEIDENFMRALEFGLPPSAGVALGLDRLFMAIHGLGDIRQSRAFSFEHVLESDKRV